MGKNSMEEMIDKAIDLKYSYLGFSEHNPSLSGTILMKVMRL